VVDGVVLVVCVVCVGTVSEKSVLGLRLLLRVMGELLVLLLVVGKVVRGHVARDDCPMPRSTTWTSSRDSRVSCGTGGIHWTAMGLGGPTQLHDGHRLARKRLAAGTQEASSKAARGAPSRAKRPRRLDSRSSLFRNFR
jgi:hypothetical protein